MKTSVFTLHLCNIPAQPIHLVWGVLHSHGVCRTMTNVSCPFSQNKRCIHAAAFKIKHREMQLQQTGTHMHAFSVYSCYISLWLHSDYQLIFCRDCVSGPWCGPHSPHQEKAGDCISAWCVCPAQHLKKEKTSLERRALVVSGAKTKNTLRYHVPTFCLINHCSANP